MRALRTFSMPETDTYERFKKICEHERVAMSKLIYEFIKLYVAQHPLED